MGGVILFELTNRYLNDHYSAETGDYSGSLTIVKACVRYQRARFWWNWHKESPQVVSLFRAVTMVLRWTFGKVNL